MSLYLKIYLIFIYLFIEFALFLHGEKLHNLYMLSGEQIYLVSEASTCDEVEFVSADGMCICTVHGMRSVHPEYSLITLSFVSGRVNYQWLDAYTSSIFFFFATAERNVCRMGLPYGKRSGQAHYTD